MTTQSSVGVVIITHHARQHLATLLPKLQNCSLVCRILVVNSSSHDGTVEEALKWGVEVEVIPRLQFNHGLTREWARKKIATPIVMMMTPDAYPIDTHLVERLTQPIRSGQAAATYARQIPHLGADLFEQFARDFHYPETSMLYNAFSVAQGSAESLFFSNSCSAYAQEALDRVGGFPHVLLGEDTLTAGALLQHGYALGYVAEAVVRHSHRYDCLAEFRRHFDIGCMRHRLATYGHSRGRDHQRGWLYAKQLLQCVAKKAPHKLPYTCFHLFSKWSGYQLGRYSGLMPHALCKFLSSQKFYWDSIQKAVLCSD